ncbi:peptide ABC transporter ATP-binding protein [Erysipelothrix larvae]|uniref:Peptide ABC transporter ATP-binding protein n=1 Tax=Erysipelothrix larvae TaxID=1514105 RepID=A0A0X8GY79_9FIRM|nr:ABC transporter ATP-binding protein [Erysipelothrix larvae]AMC92622.1 peptide ABC transporter ATP-binding protein [Erysipelothrix larvae]
MKENRILEINDFTLSFNLSRGTNHVIRNINLHVNKGETLAIVGESGSGKSVTTKAILGIIDDNGKVGNGEILYRFDDTVNPPEVLDLTKMSEKDFQTRIRGRQISIIFQDPMTALNPTMQIGKQIMESILVHKKDMPKAQAKARSIELLDMVGINDPEKRFKQYPHQLSGGMRQRVVIAIALASEPHLLIADEPTTALDVTIQAQILDLIKEIQKKTGISIIFITHDLGVVANVADRVAVMYAGKIVEEGLVDEVFYDPRHPYTWGLLSSLPSTTGNDTELYSIPGSPPNMIHPPKGDAFAYRSEYALKIDFEKEPPMFDITDTHRAASWLLDPRAPKLEMPEILKHRLEVLRKENHDE